MVLVVNGVDMIPYVAKGGFKWSRNDVDDPDTGRNMSGTMIRGRVATKIRLDITCRLLTSEEAAIVLTAIMPETVTVRYYDPQIGDTVYKTMYSNNNPAQFTVRKKDGTEWWGGITFPLVEI